MGGSLAAFAGVVTGLIYQGELKLVALLASADLALGGYQALREAYDDEEETG